MLVGTLNLEHVAQNRGKSRIFDVDLGLFGWMVKIVQLQPSDVEIFGLHAYRPAIVGSLQLVLTLSYQRLGSANILYVGLLVDLFFSCR